MGNLKLALLVLAVPLLAACSAPTSSSPTAAAVKATTVPAAAAPATAAPAPTVAAAAAPTQPPQATATKPAATVAKTATAAVTVPTQTPAAGTPIPSSAQTITQDIVFVATPSTTDLSQTTEGAVDGEVETQGSLTMKAEIQVGNVGGIDFGSKSVPMPTGAVPYDNTRLPKIGGVVQHPGGLVVQVNGVKTVDVDANNEFVVVDVTIGNTGKERELVATDPNMEIVSGDGHWYSGFWYSVYYAGTGGEQLAQQKMEEMHQSMLKKGLTSYFSAAIEPGQAARGTAVFPVPKSAKQLAFGLQSTRGYCYMIFNNEESPTIFVPLGLRGDFPAIQANVSPVKAGTTYKLGQAFKAPKRGVALQVNNVWQRLGSMTGWDLKPNEQWVVVNLLAPTYNGVKPLAFDELVLVDGSGNSYSSQPMAADWLTRPLGAYTQRGVLVFKGPRVATGLKLKFIPQDPATMSDSEPKLLAAEAATIDLGQIGPAPFAAATPGPQTGRTPTPTAPPAGTSLAAGSFASMMGVPQELRSLPIPAGFEVEEGTGGVMSTDVAFQAQVTVKGNAMPQQIVDFYTKALATGWESRGGSFGEASMEWTYYQNNTDPEVILDINVQRSNGGTTLKLELTKGDPNAPDVQEMPTPVPTRRTGVPQ